MAKARGFTPPFDNLKNGDETGGRSVSMEGIFYGGRLEPLKETFRSLLTEDEFYRQYAGEENWIFEPTT